MRRRTLGVIAGLATLALPASALQAPAAAAPSAGASGAAAAPSADAPSAADGSAPTGEAPPDRPAGPARSHDLPNPLADKQLALREQAVTKLVKGNAKFVTHGSSRAIKVGKADNARAANRGKGEYVQYDVSREESIFTILVEFGDQVDPRYGGAVGPLHNQIDQPDRNWNGDATDDNSTFWRSDFDRSHYLDMLFGDSGESLQDFYLAQSNGRFLAEGDVSDWVQAPYNEARYGSNVDERETYWSFVEDTATAWYEDQRAQGRSDVEIAAYLEQFDKWDRYDHDLDGDFDEPDGYIDHFQAIHAGEGEEAGGGAQGEDAIWSHRWYVNSTDIGQAGPEGNKLGGAPIGDSGMWIGDYTTEPENGGLGVFTHEFGHDLGLPDLYDTSGGDNGTGFWTLMSAGSWLNDGFESIGTKPGYMGPWEKFVLGWLDFEVVPNGIDTQTRLGPAAYAGDDAAQALVVPLPDQTVRADYNEPQSGEYEWWSGSGDDLNNTLTRELDLTGAESAELSTGAWYDIEEGYDYLFGEVSTDDGATWTKVGELGGSSGGAWTELDYDLGDYAGQAVQFRFRYQTDGGLAPDGAFLDDIALTLDGQQAWVDDVESGTGEWTADGFTRMTGETEEQASHYYLAENRTYDGYDTTLKTGPYNFGWASSRPDWVERFPYQNGMLVWYVNNAYEDNNTNPDPEADGHPGYGQVLPVDARPKPVRFPDGSLLGNRRQPFDATFGRERTDEVSFHRDGVKTTVESRRAKHTFNDTRVDRYWSKANPGGSTKVAGEGVRIRVLGERRKGDVLDVRVRFR